jgi:hypothetical protein
LKSGSNPQPRKNHLFTFEYGDIVFKLANLSTADPHIAGVVWRDGTTLKINIG